MVYEGVAVWWTPLYFFAIMIALMVGQLMMLLFLPLAETADAQLPDD